MGMRLITAKISIPTKKGIKATSLRGKIFLPTHTPAAIAPSKPATAKARLIMGISKNPNTLPANKALNRVIATMHPNW